MKKILTKTIAFICCFVLITLHLSKIFSYKYEDLRVDNPFNYYNFSALYELPDDSIDVAYIGGSTFYCGISPLDVWNDIGITGQVFSTPGSTVNVAYHYLQEILKTQSPKVVVFDASTFSYEDFSNENTIKAFTGIKNPLLKLKAVMANGSNDRTLFDKSLNFFEIFSLHGRWNNLESIDFYDYKKQKSYLRGYGYTEYAQLVPNLKDTFASRTDKNSPSYIKYIYDFTDIPDINKKYFENIMELCSQNGAELLLVKIPNFNWTSNHHNKVSEFAKTYDIPFIDFNTMLEDIGFNEKESFWDYNPYTQNGHLNYDGAKKISRYLSDFLSRNYSFTSRSKDVLLKWETDYLKFLSAQKEQELHVCMSFSRYIELLKNLDKQKYLICIAAKDEAFTSLTQEHIRELNELGILVNIKTEPYSSYLTILGDGKTLYENISDNDALSCEVTYLGNRISLESATFFVGNNCSITINNIDYAVNQRGLNFVIWNIETHQLVDSVAFDTWGTLVPHRNTLYFN